MPSVLLLSKKITDIELLESLTTETALRLKHVTTKEAAIQWVDMQSYEMILVEASFGLDTSFSLASHAWQKNPLSVSGIYSFENPVPEALNAKVDGIITFSGDDVEEQLRSFFLSFAEKDDKVSSGPEGILLVEDLDSPREIICAYIEQLGYSDVNGVAGAEECMKELAEHPMRYFVIVTDLQMPKISGTKLIHQIRHDDEFRHLPIIVLTSAGTEENFVSSIKAGASGFLIKPPKKESLQVELEKAKRINYSRLNPRLCDPQDSHLIEEILIKRGLR